MIYFVLFLHFGFYVFFIMLFSAFIFSALNNNRIKKLAVFYLILYSIIELILFAVLLYSALFSVAWGVLILSLSAALITVFALRTITKIDLTMWVPFSVLFMPLIIIPAIFFLFMFCRKYSISNITSDIDILQNRFEDLK